MPRYTIGLPDGRVMTADANSEADAFAGAQAWYAANPKVSPAAGARAAAVDQRPPAAPDELETLYPSGFPGQVAPENDPSTEGTLQEAAQGASMGFADELAATAGRGGNMAMRGLGMDVPEMSRDDILKGIRERGDKFREKNPGTATAARVAGSLAPGAGIGLGLGRALGVNPSGFWGATGLGTAGGAVQGGVDALGQQEGKTDPWGAAREGAVGGAWGGAFGAAGNTAAKVVGPWATRAAQTLTERGIRLTPGQLLGGTAQRFEDTAQDIPFVGQMSRNRRQEGLEDFNRVATQDAIAPLETVPGVNTPQFDRNSEHGRAMYASAHRAVSDAYDTIVPQMRGDVTDNLLLHEIVDIGDALPQSEQGAFIANVGSYLERADRHGTGVVRGRSMQDVISAMRDQSRKYATDQTPGTYSRELSQAFNETAIALEENLERHSAPEVLQRFAQVQQAFAQLVPVEKAVGSLGAEGGVFSPAQLLSGVKGSDRSVRKNAFARGARGDVQGLAEDGKEVMSARVRNSGSGERLFMQNLPWAVAGGSVIVNPWIAGLVPLALGSQTNVAQRVFQGAATMSPATRMALRRAMERVSPTAGAVGGMEMGQE
jgi:hypothetical protein